MVNTDRCLPALLVATLSLPACQSTHRVAGSIPLQEGAPRTLALRSERTADLVLKMWNRGPAAVHFAASPPAQGVASELTSGVIAPDLEEYTWHATTGRLEIALTTDGEATVAYAVESDRGIELSIESR